MISSSGANMNCWSSVLVIEIYKTGSMLLYTHTILCWMWPSKIWSITMTLVHCGVCRENMSYKGKHFCSMVWAGFSYMNLHGASKTSFYEDCVFHLRYVTSLEHSKYTNQGHHCFFSFAEVNYSKSLKWSWYHIHFSPSKLPKSAWLPPTSWRM